MKKIISILLSCMIALSVLSSTGAACLSDMNCYPDVVNGGENYNLKNVCNEFTSMDGNAVLNPGKKLYETEELKSLLSVYGKEIGIGANIMDESGGAVLRTLDGKEVIEYRGLRIFTSSDNFMVFGLSDMMCTVGEEVIGEYRFNNPVFFGVEKNKSGLCVYYNGKIYSIKDAINEGITTADALAKIIPFTEGADKTYPTITVPTSPETTSPKIPDTSAPRPTMPVIIPDTRGGRYEIEDYPKVESEETTVELSTEPDETITTEPETVKADITVTEPAENSEIKEPASTQATETVWYSEFVNTQPESVESTSVDNETVAVANPPETQAVFEKSDVKDTKKANPIKVSAASKTIKAKKLKKAKAAIKAFTVKNAQGKVTFTLVKKDTSAKIFKNITVNGKTGIITLKKGKYTRKTYTVGIRIKASGNSVYKSKTGVKKIKIKIK